HHGGKGRFCQVVERLRSTKEAGDIDQNVTKEGFNSLMILAEKLQIRLKRVDFSQEHAPRDAPSDRSRLIKAEIDLAGGSKQYKYLVQRVIGHCPVIAIRFVVRSKQLRMRCDAFEFMGYFFRRQDKIDITAGNRI